MVLKNSYLVKLNSDKWSLQSFIIEQRIKSIKIKKASAAKVKFKTLALKKISTGLSGKPIHISYVKTQKKSIESVN